MDTVIEIEVSNALPTIPSLTESESRNRAELASWFDWGEAPWTVFEIETQPQGGTNASG
jgi:hypothetical protein